MSTWAPVDRSMATLQSRSQLEPGKTMTAALVRGAFMWASGDAGQGGGQAGSSAAPGFQAVEVGQELVVPLLVPITTAVGFHVAAHSILHRDRRVARGAGFGDQIGGASIAGGIEPVGLRGLVRRRGQ